MAGKTKNAKTADNKNLGLSLLIALMSFEVIIGFEWNIYSAVKTGVLGWLFYLRIIAIPVLIMLTFYSFQRKLVSKSGNEIWDRILRVVVPIAGWAFVYWLFYLLMGERLEAENSRPIGVDDLIKLFVSGNSDTLNPVMWVLIGTVVVALIFLLFILVAPKFYNVVFIVLLVVALVIQYTGLALGKLINVGGFFEILDYLPAVLGLAAVGFLIASYGFTQSTGKWWPITVPVTIVLVVLLRYFSVFRDISELSDNNYEGIKIIVLSAVLLFMFSAPPLDRLPKFVHIVVSWLTRYALGVFCINRLVSYVLNYTVQHSTWMPIESDSFFYCVIVYIFSYLIALLISLIPCKWTRMLVQND